jgi:hypothetical protein
MAIPTIPDTLPGEAIERVINATVNDLDAGHLAMLSRIAPVEKLRLLGAMIDSMKQMIFAAERQFNPGLPEVEIWLRVAVRWIHMSEWEPQERERFLIWLQHKLLQRNIARDNDGEE